SLGSSTSRKLVAENWPHHLYAKEVATERLGYCSCSCCGHLAASAFGGCFGHKYATAASTNVRSAGKGRILAT
ncbi:unnamed protein product, partial [Cladocopium goreaui]